MIEVFVFIFGAMIGSFLNVCIHRMPREESIVRPGSHCPACKKTVAWKDNIPLLSFLLLKGKCRHCQAKISPRYFAVELIVAVTWLVSWFLFGVSSLFISGIIYLSILIAVTVTDLETGLIPDKLSIPGMILGLMISSIFPQLRGETIWYLGLLHSLIGLLAGGGILLATAMLGNLLFKKESMGGGDIKLLAMIGAFIGWKGAVFAFLFSPFLALPVGLYMKLIKKAETIAYGPYLAVAGVGYFFFEKQILKYFFYY